MPDPLLSLVVAAAIGGALALFFWPERGLFWRWQRTRQMTERVLIEDALKRLYEEQSEGRCSSRSRPGRRAPYFRRPGGRLCWRRWPSANCWNLAPTRSA